MEPRSYGEQIHPEGAAVEPTVSLDSAVEAVDYSALDFDSLQAMERPGSMCNVAAL